MLFSMKMFRRIRKYLIYTFLLYTVTQVLYKPMPTDITEQDLLFYMEPLIRFTYYYPVSNTFVQSELLADVNTYAQILWIRFWMNGGGYVANYVIHEPGINQIYEDSFDGVPVTIFEPSQRNNDGAVLFIHGGGFTFMDALSYSLYTQEVTRTTGMVVVSIEYRLAPEHIFPAAVEDCEKATVAFLTKHYKTYNVDPTKVVIMGDSAGGNLAAVTALRLRNKNFKPPLKLQVLIYPMMQLVDFLSPSCQLVDRKLSGMSFLKTVQVARLWLIYLGIDTSYLPVLLANNHTSKQIRSDQDWSRILGHLDHDNLPEAYKRPDIYIKPPCMPDGHDELSKQLAPFIFNPDVSPISSTNLSGLPRTLVVTVEYDPLRDDGYRYYQRLKEDGIDASLYHYEQGFHVMLNFYPQFSLARKVFVDIGKYVTTNIA